MGTYKEERINKPITSQFIGLFSPPSAAEYELVLRRHNKRLEPDGIIRIKSPVKDKNITEETYTAKVVEYITGKWIKEHPGKPYYFHPHCKPQK